MIQKVILHFFYNNDKLSSSTTPPIGKIIITKNYLEVEEIDKLNSQVYPIQSSMLAERVTRHNWQTRKIEVSR
jgi:hypothetical protein